MTHTPPRLSDHVALISGGLGDIGRAIGCALAVEGAAVALGDILPETAAAEALAELRASGVAATYTRCDVGDPDAVAAWVDATETALGLPTLIIPNAARVTIAGCLELTPQQWRDEMHVNLDGAYFMARAAAARLVAAARPGRIVFVGSWAGHRAHAALPAYSVSKAGLRMLMSCLAIELAPRDIAVNEVAPGYVDAGLSGKLFDQNPGSRERAAARVPLRRLISSAEVAAQVLHLCLPANRHMTGSVLLMDGGLSLMGPAST